MKVKNLFIVISIIFLFYFSNCNSREIEKNQIPDCTKQTLEYIKIPMRDGEELAAFVRRPKDPKCSMPVILIQTPYNKEKARELWFENSEGEPLFNSTDYAFVVVDWRGFFASVNAAVQGIQPYGEDGYDIVEWIASQPWSNGKIGTWGVSAVGAQQYVTAVESPPHLKAAVPIFCRPNTMYEQYYPGGVLRKEYLDFVGPYYGMDNFILSHPFYDVTWLYVENIRKMSDIKIPVLVVAGWYDHWNYGVFNTFNLLCKDSDITVRDQHRLLIGDWHHFAAGGESIGAGRNLNPQELKYFDSERRIQHDSLLFFDYHLRGIENEASRWSKVRYIQSGENIWKSSNQWPPITTEDVTFYLTGDGLLTGDMPSSGKIEFPYDPDDPSPTVGGGTIRFDLLHGPQHQSLVLKRKDAVVFCSVTLTEPMRIAGKIKVNLVVKTTGYDTDFAVRFTDVDKDGKYLLIDEGIQRLKLRNNFSTISPVTPGEHYSISITLINELSYTFASGHRIGLIITSSNYPRFDRNPNTGDNFYDDAETPKAVINTLILDGESKLILPILY